MKKVIALSAVVLLISFVSNSEGQNRYSVEDSWKWVVPLKTRKADIEKVFGQSITRDKGQPFQTYVTDFGKINVAFATETRYIEEYSCTVEKGTVLNYFISPRRRFRLSDLRYDLTKFEKDETYSPRELSYFSEAEGVLIATEIIEKPDKSQVEMVRSIEYRPKLAKCKEPNKE